MIKRLFIFAAAVMMIGLSGCHKHNEVDENEILKAGIQGCWELTSVTTKSASVGNVTVDVYIEFLAPDAMTLYQKIGEGRYTKFTGTYTLAEKQLSGTYTSGNKKTWGPYDATLDDEAGILTLALPEKTEKDVYKKIESIPSAVTSNVY